MFGWIFGGLHALLDTIVLIGLIGGWLVFGVCLLISRFIPKLLTPTIYPIFKPVQWIAGLIGTVCAIIKLATIVTFLLGAHGEIKDLKSQLESKKAEIGKLQANAGRKAEQASAVTKGDKDIDIRYVPRWRTIESIRTVPDLSLANRLMLDNTTNFYEPEKADAQAANSR